MSLSGRLRYRRRGKRKGRTAVISVKQFEVEADLKPADWAEFLQKFRALLKHYGIRLKSQS